MPAIVIEEDYDDEVSRLLSGIPATESSPPLSARTPPQEEKNDHGDKLSELHSSLNDLQRSLSNLQLSLGSLSNPDQLNRSLGASTSSSSRRDNSQNAPVSFDQKNLISTSIAPVIRLDKLEDRLSKIEAGMKDEEASYGSTFELCSLPSYVDPLNVSMNRSRRSLDRSRGSALDRSRGGQSLSSSRHRYGNPRIGIDQSQHSIGSKRLAEVVVVPKKENIESKYFVDHSREIGRGTNTIVRKCICRATGNRYAVKSVRRSDTEEYENMRKEANLLTALDHPGIIKIYDTFEDDKHLHMVVEICKGGELFDHVVKPSKNKKGVELNCPEEKVAAVIVRQVVDAVAYLHEHNIVHRDLKVSPC